MSFLLSKLLLFFHPAKSRAVLVIALVLPAVFAAQLVVAPRGGRVIPDEFIITVQAGANAAALETEIDSILSANNGAVLHRYTHTIKGYAVRANSAALANLLKINGIRIEANLEMHTMDCHTQDNTCWGLNRISEHTLKIDNAYLYGDATGAGVDVYIVDTGIYIENEDFEGRATWGTDTVDNPSPKTDGNGHGTHVASTVGGKSYGVAKKVDLIAVKVLSASGSGSTAGVIKGIDWVAEQHKKKNGAKPSAANMSLGGGYSLAMNSAVDAAVASGVSFAVAAGNEAQDACNVSPASAESPVTTGSTDIHDDRSYFSNWGKCVNVFAPGSDITAAWIGGKTATKTISGTSMASPHVCGVMARYLQTNPTATPASVMDYISDHATNDVVQDAKTGSPNKLLYSGACEY